LAATFARQRMRLRQPLLIFVTFAVVFLLAGTYASRQKSAVYDEPIHLAAGYAAVGAGDFRIDPSHPPLLRALAALPGWISGQAVLRLPAIDDEAPLEWLPRAYPFAQRFLYNDNNADRVLERGRLVIRLLGILLAGLMFLWLREWLGLTAAVFALVLFAVEPNLNAHSMLVTTDLGVTCFIFGTVYFLWRTAQTFTWPNVIGVAVCCGLAVASKFSGLILGPIVLVLVGITWRRNAYMTARQALTIVAACAAGTWLIVWASYGFRYAPSANPQWVFDFVHSSAADSSPVFARIVQWTDRYHLLPNAFSGGLLYAADTARQLPAFLAGDVNPDGWWYYFPLALLLKTPLSLLLLLALGVWTIARRPIAFEDTTPFIVVPIAAYLGVAMLSGVNIGVRHVLPVFPFLLMVAAAGCASLFLGTARRVVLTVLMTTAVAEFASVYPFSLTFFNPLIGGSHNGYRYLADSNLSWGQGLKRLKRWMDAHNVEHLNLAYFGQADPRYYGLSVTHLPGAPGFATSQIARPTLPGYVAISSTVLSGPYLSPEWRLFYAGFADLQPVAVVGNSIRVYWVNEWPEPVSAGDDDADLQKQLADGLLHGYGWAAHAAKHYAHYLSVMPNDVDALIDYGLALGLSGRTGDSVVALRRAVTIQPRYLRGQLTFARLLLGLRDADGAESHARAAVALDPASPDAHLLLGRIFAIQGRRPDAIMQFERVLTLRPGDREATVYLDRLGEGVNAALTTR
jgi:hypothetical protein